MPSSFPSPAVIQATVGTSSAQVIASNVSRVGIFVFNPSATVPIWICPANQAQTTGTPAGPANPAAINGTGSIVLQPQQGLMLGEPGGMPAFTAALNAICSTPSTPLTIWEFYK